MPNKLSDRTSTLKDIAAQSVFRAHGMLAGGICFAVCSIAVLVFSAQYGYEYNYFIPLAGYGAGYIAGTVVELIHKAVSITRKSD